MNCQVCSNVSVKNICDTCKAKVDNYVNGLPGPLFEELEKAVKERSRRECLERVKDHGLTGSEIQLIQQSDSVQAVKKIRDRTGLSLRGSYYLMKERRGW